MNLIKAVKSGKRFKRPMQIFYIHPEEISKTSFSLEDLTANDWHVSPLEIKITEEKFNDAWDKAEKATSKLDMYIIMCKELGL